MSRTIFILGMDPEHCAELRTVLQAAVTDTIVTTSPTDSFPRLRESDSLVLSNEERNAGVIYRQLLQRVDQQVHRAQVLGELIRLSISSRNLEDILEKIVEKTTSLLGDTAFIVLDSDAKYQLEAAFCSDSARLKKMLITAVNVAPQALANELIREVLENGEPVVVSNLQQFDLGPELQTFIDKYEIFSLLVTPIRG